jgi:hypothetical protein
MTPSCRIDLKVIPGASRTEVAGRLEGMLKVRVRAPALEGRANDELCAFLAEKLGIHRRSVTVETGALARRKTVRIEGLEHSDAEARLLEA